MSSLLEKAKEIGTRTNSGGQSDALTIHELRERCELAIAWATGGVSTAQIRHALNDRSPSNGASKLGFALLRGIRVGIVKAELVAPK